MNVIALVPGQRAARTTSRATVSPLRQLGQLVARTVAVLVAAGVIVAGATAVGYSPLASQLPTSFLPSGQEQHQGGVPAAAQGAPAAGAGQASGATHGAGGQPTGSTDGSGGVLTGRNAPSLQSGLRQDLSNLAISSGLTAISALALSLLSRRRRPTPGRSAPGRSSSDQLVSQPPATGLQSA